VSSDGVRLLRRVCISFRPIAGRHSEILWQLLKPQGHLRSQEIALRCHCSGPLIAPDNTVPPNRRKSDVIAGPPSTAETPETARPERAVKVTLDMIVVDYRQQGNALIERLQCAGRRIFCSCGCVVGNTETTPKWCNFRLGGKPPALYSRHVRNLRTPRKQTCTQHRHSACGGVCLYLWACGVHDHMGIDAVPMVSGSHLVCTGARIRI
jgi:hypothetical protein